MNLNLDPATQQRIQREIELGHYAEPAEVVAGAVALLEAEENWLLENKSVINERLKASMAQIERGQGIPADELVDYLAAKRKSG